jgi:hypothetical protein
LELADLYEQKFFIIFVGDKSKLFNLFFHLSFVCQEIIQFFFVLNLSYTTVFGINVKFINFNFSAELIVLSLSEQT